jgi:hypothetical protein
MARGGIRQIATPDVHSSPAHHTRRAGRVFMANSSYQRRISHFFASFLAPRDKDTHSEREIFSLVFEEPTTYSFQLRFLSELSAPLAPS